MRKLSARDLEAPVNKVDLITLVPFRYPMQVVEQHTVISGLGQSYGTICRGHDLSRTSVMTFSIWSTGLVGTAQSSQVLLYLRYFTEWYIFRTKFPYRS